MPTLRPSSSFASTAGYDLRGVVPARTWRVVRPLPFAISNNKDRDWRRLDDSGARARIDSLDFIRGVAVMGILVANLPAFGLPEAAYFSPLAWGGSAGWDRLAWVATYVLVEGKMRGLFSMLFGASMLLVVDRARAAGDSPARIHYARMATLFAIGCAHLYLSGGATS